MAKPGSTDATLTASATYPSTCANPVLCNQATSTTDPRGNITDYTYDGIHGGVTSVTGPAPVTGADRPQVRYTHSQTQGEYQLTEVSACASGTSSTCVGTAAETRAKSSGQEFRGHYTELISLVRARRLTLLVYRPGQSERHRHA